METRNDFKSVEGLLHRLIQFASVFQENNHDRWSHLKNREDFDAVYGLEWDVRAPLESIYCDGRDLAVFMSSRLVGFNYPSEFPTLKRFVDSFDNGWLYQIDLLKEASQRAKDTLATLEHQPSAVDQMIRLHDSQISLLQDVKQTIDALRESDIYKFESGQRQASFPVPEYQRILDCINTIGQMFERLPSTYSEKDEESLRDHILVSLQAIVAGSATGETFNKRGKTDILVRNGDRNEFVGECKFWRGRAAYLETIDQLLSYLSWRDTNGAVIIFVPNVDFSAVLNEIVGITSSHPNYLRTVAAHGETWHNFEFRMIEDRARVVKLAALFFHIPPSA